MPELIGLPNTLVGATKALRKIPNNYGMVAQKGIFRSDSINTTHVRVQEVNGVLSLIPSQPRGSESNKNVSGNRRFHYVEIPHFPLNDQILATDVQDVVDFDTGEMSDSVVEAVARSLADQRNKHAITLEHLLCTALNGKVLDADGSVLVNYFTQFGVTPKVIDIALSSSTLDVRGKTFEVTRHIEDNLLGDVMNETLVLASPAFFDAFVGHKNVEKAFVNTTTAQNMVGGDVRTGFKFGSITLVEYRGKADGIGGVRNFIPENKALAIPLGTQNTFELWYGPPVLNGVTNANRKASIGPYALTTTDTKGRFVDVDTELNCLPLVRRPGVLVELTMS